MTEQPQRVAFFDGQVLRTRDLTDEQAYHLRAARDHNTETHTWGIVRGLGLTRKGNTIAIADGVAVAPDGRVGKLPNAILAPAETGSGNLKLDDNKVRNIGRFDVWLVFPSEEDSRECNGCDSRVNDVPHVDVVRATGGDPRTADGTNRVFLGRVQVTDTPPPNDWEIRTDGRRYIGVVAERVIAPIRPDAKEISPGVYDRTWVQMGQPENKQEFYFAVHGPGEGTEPPFRVEPTGTTTYGPGVRIDGDLTIANGGAIGFAPNFEETGDAKPLGWKIYRQFKKLDDKDAEKFKDLTQFMNEGLALPGDELRIVIPEAKSDSITPKLTVGTWDKAFRPILEVSSEKNQGRVVVHGNLIIKGEYLGPPPIIGGSDSTIPGGGDLLTFLLDKVGVESVIEKILTDKTKTEAMATTIVAANDPERIVLFSKMIEVNASKVANAIDKTKYATLLPALFANAEDEFVASIANTKVMGKVVDDKTRTSVVILALSTGNGLTNFVQVCDANPSPITSIAVAAMEKLNIAKAVVGSIPATSAVVDYYNEVSKTICNSGFLKALAAEMIVFNSKVAVTDPDMFKLWDVIAEKLSEVVLPPPPVSDTKRTRAFQYLNYLNDQSGIPAAQFKKIKGAANAV